MNSPLINLKLKDIDESEMKVKIECDDKVYEYKIDDYFINLCKKVNSETTQMQLGKFGFREQDLYMSSPYVFKAKLLSERSRSTAVQKLKQSYVYFIKRLRAIEDEYDTGDKLKSYNLSRSRIFHLMHEKEEKEGIQWTSRLLEDFINELGVNLSAIRTLKVYKNMYKKEN